MLGSTPAAGDLGALHAGLGLEGLRGVGSSSESDLLGTGPGGSGLLDTSGLEQGEDRIIFLTRWPKGMAMTKT